MKIIAEVDPEPARGLDLPLRVPHLHRRVVGVDRAAQKDQRLHQVVQRLERLGGAGHPVAEGRARQFHPLPGQAALLAMERDMVGILFGDHMSQESRPGQALLDRLGGLAGRDDLAFAVRAGVRAADVFDHEQGRRLDNRVARCARRRSGSGSRHTPGSGARLRSTRRPEARGGGSWARPCGRGDASVSWGPCPVRAAGGTASVGSEVSGATGSKASGMSSG